MKKFKGKISIGFAAAKREFEFEVEDDATDEEIETIAHETAMELVNWDYEPAC